MERFRAVQTAETSVAALSHAPLPWQNWEPLGLHVHTAGQFHGQRMQDRSVIEGAFPQVRAAMRRANPRLNNPRRALY